MYNSFILKVIKIIEKTESLWTKITIFAYKLNVWLSVFWILKDCLTIFVYLKCWWCYFQKNNEGPLLSFNAHKYCCAITFNSCLLSAVFLKFIKCKKKLTIIFINDWLFGFNFNFKNKNKLFECFIETKAKQQINILTNKFWIR